MIILLKFTTSIHSCNQSEIKSLTKFEQSLGFHTMSLLETQVFTSALSFYDEKYAQVNAFVAVIFTEEFAYIPWSWWV